DSGPQHERAIQDPKVTLLFCRPGSSLLKIHLVRPFLPLHATRDVVATPWPISHSPTREKTPTRLWLVGWSRSWHSATASARQLTIRMKLRRQFLDTRRQDFAFWPIICETETSRAEPKRFRFPRYKAFFPIRYVRPSLR